MLISTLLNNLLKKREKQSYQLTLGYDFCDQKRGSVCELYLQVNQKDGTLDYLISYKNVALVAGEIVLDIKELSVTSLLNTLEKIKLIKPKQKEGVLDIDQTWEFVHPIEEKTLELKASTKQHEVSEIGAIQSNMIRCTRESIEYVIQQKIESRLMLENIAKKENLNQRDPRIMIAAIKSGIAREFCDEMRSSSPQIEFFFQCGTLTNLIGVGNCGEFCALSFTKLFHSLILSPQQKHHTHLVVCSLNAHLHEFILLVTTEQHQHIEEKKKKGKPFFSISDFPNKDSLIIIDAWGEDLKRRIKKANSQLDPTVFSQFIQEEFGQKLFMCDIHFPLTELLSPLNILAFNRTQQNIPTLFSNWLTSTKGKRAREALNQLSQMVKKEITLDVDQHKIFPLLSEK
jgi:hypothetical protein